VDQDEARRYAKVLNCNIMTIPFVYLGLPVGADARKVNTWELVIDKMRKKLTPWRRKHLPFGGRICLIESVLSSLPLYYLSFFKFPKKVVAILNMLQRNFCGGLMVKKIVS